MPCNLIEDAFRDRRSGRISILRFPSDSRMYARVLREGIVRPGDAIEVLRPAADSRPSCIASSTGSTPSNARRT